METGLANVLLTHFILNLNLVSILAAINISYCSSGEDDCHPIQR